MLNLGEHGQVVAFAEDITGVLERGEQPEGFFEVVGDIRRRMLIGGAHLVPNASGYWV